MHKSHIKFVSFFASLMDKPRDDYEEPALYAMFSPIFGSSQNTARHYRNMAEQYGFIFRTNSLHRNIRNYRLNRERIWAAFKEVPPAPPEEKGAGQ